MAERDPMTATTLTEVLRRRTALDPTRPYFHLYGETVTYGRLWEQSARYAGALRAAGVNRGDKVALIYPTCAEFFATFLGALRVGAALSRHGLDRLRVYAAARRDADLAVAARPAQSATVARAHHGGPGHVHGLAGLRLSQLRSQRARCVGDRPDQPAQRAVGRRAGAPVDDRGLRATLRA